MDSLLVATSVRVGHGTPSWPRLVRYVHERRNPDGGYSFARGAPSSAADTFYAVRILRLLGSQPDRPGDTAEFLQRLQRRDGSFDSVRVAYFVTMGLRELGSAPARCPIEPLRAQQRPDGSFGSLEADSESPSEWEQSFLAVWLLHQLGAPLELAQTCRTILARQNADGSFGQSGYSRLAGTAHAIGILTLAGQAAAALPRALAFVRGCEDPAGGFRPAPSAPGLYRVVDDIYYGCLSLSLMNEIPRYPAQTLAFVAGLQNANGGIRRSPFLGIATLEAAYAAVTASVWIGDSSSRTAFP